MSNGRLTEYLQRIREDLDRTVNFWLKHSHDNVNGYYSFLKLSAGKTTFNNVKVVIYD
jgi:hypothetical protein